MATLLFATLENTAKRVVFPREVLISDQLGIDDRHVGSKRVISERELLIGFFIGDNGERSDLRTGSAGGRNSDQHRLFAEGIRLAEWLSE